MSLREAILPGLEVLTSDGLLLGTVARVEGEAIAVTAAGAGARSRLIPIALVARVDRHVHLKADRAGLDAAAAAAAAGAGLGAAASPASAEEPLEGPLPPVRNPAVGNARPRGNYYLPWVLGGLLLLLLLFGLLRGCDTDTDERVDRRPVAAQPGDENRSKGGRYETGTIAHELDRFLASGEPAPRTLRFERLNFDTGSAAVRAEDVPDLDQIAQVLNAHPRARIAIIGYTDALGSGRANARLGGERARAIVDGLVTRGISAERLEGRSGGEDQPVGSNRRPEGRAENRRTELIVLSR
jgi:outer membrane protein OmpA-like peptidoglycan-associated protein